MEGAAAFFQNDMTFKTIINGTINDIEFKVVGEGTSKAPHGDFMIHAVCETGQLPMSWKALCHVLQYGQPAFGLYPNGLTHFCQEAFPEGFTIDRTVRFEGDGTMTSHHSYELDGDCVTSRVNLKCTGFDPQGAVMQDGLRDILTTESHMFPIAEENALRQLCFIGFVKNDDSIMISHFDSKMSFCGSRKIKLPNPHFVTIVNKQMKDESETRDHIVQREINTARPAPRVVSAI